MNEQSQWRIDLAQKLVPGLARSPVVDAIFVGGSAGRGDADDASDLDIGIIWSTPPTDDQRRRFIDSIKAYQFTDFVPFSAEPKKATGIEDNISYYGFQIDLCHLLTDTVGQWVYDVAVSGDARHQYKQSLVAALAYGHPIYGSQLIDPWKRQVAEYPKRLMAMTVAENLPPCFNQNVHLLIERNEPTIFYNFVSGLQKRLGLIYLALNGRYFEGFKHLNSRMKDLANVPNNAVERFAQCYSGDPSKDWQVMHGLIEETLPLIQNAMPKLDMAAVRDQHSYERRRFTAPPDEED